MTTAELASEPGPDPAPNAPADDASGVPGWAYRPHLDGLRAIAVYLVVAFHAGASQFRNGFVGVDVFFVLSGYLVTNLLLRDVRSHGSVRFRRFYARRVRRLLPAALVNLLVTAVVFRMVAAPIEFADATGAIRSAALYVSNWWFIRESTDYFGTDVASSPVAQYWSLSVEEQFYVVWPVLLAGIALVTARLFAGRRWAVAAVIAALGVGSVLVDLSLRDDPSRAYYGTVSRAYQLLAGALLAALPGIIAFGRRAPRARAAAAVAALAFAGLLVISTGLVELTPLDRGLVVTAITLVLLVAIEAGDTGPVRRFLSLEPLAFLGRISYGTYLWHWIVILVIARELDLGTTATVVVAVLVSTALAALSYVVLEQPIRTNPALDRRPGAVIASGLAASAVVGLLVVPWVLAEPGGSPSASRPSTGMTGGPARPDWRAAQDEEPDLEPCDLAAEPVCQLTSGERGKVLLVGESHAAMLAPGFEAWAERNDVELAVAYLPYCPWTRGIKYSLLSPDCYERQEEMFRERIPAYDPDLVVLAHRPVDDPIDPVPTEDVEGGPLYFERQRDAAVERRVRSTLKSLRQRDIPVVLVEPIPVSDDAEPPLACLSELPGDEPLSRCEYRASPSPRAEERVFRAAADADDSVWSLDLDRAICPDLPRCAAVVDGHIVMYDNSHLTTGFSETLADAIDSWADEQGVLEAIRP